MGPTRSGEAYSYLVIHSFNHLLICINCYRAAEPFLFFRSGMARFGAEGTRAYFVPQLHQRDNFGFCVYDEF